MKFDHNFVVDRKGRGDNLESLSEQSEESQELVRDVSIAVRRHVSPLRGKG